MKRYSWREKVADWWGRAGSNGEGRASTMTAGDVNKVNDESLQAMCDFLNTDTVNEVARGIGRAGGGPSATEVNNSSRPDSLNGVAVSNSSLVD